MRNHIAHGRADRIDISLTRDVGKGALSIRNDVGLPEGVYRESGTGMHAMDFQGSAIRGSFKVRRHPPRGTLIACVFLQHRTRGNHEDPGDASDGG